MSKEGSWGQGQRQGAGRLWRVSRLHRLPPEVKRGGQREAPSRAAPCGPREKPGALASPGAAVRGDASASASSAPFPPEVRPVPLPALPRAGTSLGRVLSRNALSSAPRAPARLARLGLRTPGRARPPQRPSPRSPGPRPTTRFHSGLLVSCPPRVGPEAAGEESRSPPAHPENLRPRSRRCPVRVCGVSGRERQPCALTPPPRAVPPGSSVLRPQRTGTDCHTLKHLTDSTKKKFLESYYTTNAYREGNVS